MLRIFGRERHRNSAHCTSTGKVLLAHLPERRRAALLEGRCPSARPTPPYVDPARLRAELRPGPGPGLGREHRRARARRGHVAAPVRNARGEVIAAVSVAGPVMRVNGDTLRRFFRASVEAADAISDQLGWRPGLRGPPRSLRASPRTRSRRAWCSTADPAAGPSVDWGSGGGRARPLPVRRPEARALFDARRSEFRSRRSPTPTRAHHGRRLRRPARTGRPAPGRRRARGRLQGRPDQSSRCSRCSASTARLRPGARLQGLPRRRHDPARPVHRSPRSRPRSSSCSGSDSRAPAHA